MMIAIIYFFIASSIAYLTRWQWCQLMRWSSKMAMMRI